MQDRAYRQCPRAFLGVACFWGGLPRALLVDADTAHHGGYSSGAVGLYEKDSAFATTRWQLFRRALAVLNRRLGSTQ